MKKLMVIADDLTGACDTGIKFSEQGYRTRVLMPAALYDSYQDDSVDVFSVTTNTRNCSEEEAVEKISDLFEQVDGNYRFYKKIDSVLRGNIRAELDCFIDKGYARKSLICSAYIEEGRTIEDGNLHIRKKDKEIFSNAAEKMGLKSFCHVDLQTVRKGCKAIVEAVNATEERHVILDAVNNDDLYNIALAAGQLPDCIPAGSAGLAKQYCKCLFEKQEKQIRSEKNRGVPLLIIGTRNPVTVAQTQKLKDLNLEIHLLNTDEYGMQVESTETIKKRCRKGILLTTNLIYNNTGNNGELLLKNCHNSNILDYISAETEKIFADNRISGILASGGDVCASVLETLNLNKIDLIEEVLPGIVAGEAIGKDNRKTKVITKSGGFGDEDALVKIFEYMR